MAPAWGREGSVLHVVQRREFTVYENVEVPEQTVDEGDLRGRLELPYAADVRAAWCFGWRPRFCIVEGYARHVSDVLRISKCIDVGHRGSWGHGSRSAIAVQAGG